MIHATTQSGVRYSSFYCFKEHALLFLKRVYHIQIAHKNEFAVNVAQEAWNLLQAVKNENLNV